MMRAIQSVALAAALATLAGCATVQTTSKDDPFEPWNRAMYDVHQVVDGKIIKPVAQAYVDNTPPPIRQGVSNFFGNLDDVVSVLNDWLQWKLDKAGNDMGRVMINSFFGLGGIIDIASQAGIEKGNEDFGQTFGVWGFPQGPYLFIPVLGPTTVRDGTGLIVRAYASPLSYVVVDVPTRNILYAIGFLDARAQALQAENFVEGAALDRYTFIRRAYLQRRAYLVRDGKPAPPSDDD
ncbi:MAG TPA: VacJ family lipoprotein [Casimicrobiaceae bacterium]|nr:VacJ family lipoprotein [Casimicrobiaceae bacterium]